MKKLNAKGITHLVAMAAVVVLVTIVGVAYLVGSHAGSKGKTGTLYVTAYNSANQIGTEIKGKVLDIQPLSLPAGSGAVGCKNPHSDGKFDTGRNIVCGPGQYKVSLYKNYNKGKFKGSFQGETTVTVTAGHKTKTRLQADYKDYQTPQLP